MINADALDKRYEPFTLDHLEKLRGEMAALDHKVSSSHDLREIKQAWKSMSQLIMNERWSVVVLHKRILELELKFESQEKETPK